MYKHSQFHTDCCDRLSTLSQLACGALLHRQPIEHTARWIIIVIFFEGRRTVHTIEVTDSFFSAAAPPATRTTVSNRGSDVTRVGPASHTCFSVVCMPATSHPISDAQYEDDSVPFGITVTQETASHSLSTLHTCICLGVSGQGLR